MINAKISKDEVSMNISGSEAEIVAESMVLLKAIYDGLKDAGAKHVKSNMRLAIIYSLLSGNLFDEDPASELLDSFFEKASDNDANMEILEEILEKEDTLRKAIEKAAAYGD